MRSWKKIVAFLLTLFIVIIILLFIIKNGDKRVMNIKQNKIVLSTEIYKIDFFPRSDGFWVYYRFNWKGKMYDSKTRLILPKKLKSEVERLLLNRYMLLVCDSSNIENNKLPLSSEDFRELEVNCPDTLSSFYFSIDSIENAYK